MTIGRDRDRLARNAYQHGIEHGRWAPTCHRTLDEFRRTSMYRITRSRYSVLDAAGADYARGVEHGWRTPTSGTPRAGRPD